MTDIRNFSRLQYSACLKFVLYLNSYLPNVLILLFSYFSLIALGN